MLHGLALQSRGSHPRAALTLLSSADVSVVLTGSNGKTLDLSGSVLLSSIKESWEG